MILGNTNFGVLLGITPPKKTQKKRGTLKQPGYPSKCDFFDGQNYSSKGCSPAEPFSALFWNTKLNPCHSINQKKLLTIFRV